MPNESSGVCDREESGSDGPTSSSDQEFFQIFMFKLNSVRILLLDGETFVIGSN